MTGAERRVTRTMARPVADWDLSDLELLIKAQVSESLHLDYKASEALSNEGRVKTEIAKDISAFANSAGGRVIYGVVERDHLPMYVDSGCDETTVSREWLENVITSNISPRISGLLIKPIPLGNGRSAFVVDIPAATASGPHQASDHRYYKRFNFKSVPMEDYEVRDIMRRGATPNLRPRANVKRIKEDPYTGTAAAELGLMVQNLSSQPAFYTVMRFFVESTAEVLFDVPWQQRNSLTLALGGDGWIKAHCLEQVRIAPRDLPLFKEELFYPGDVAVVLALNVKEVLVAFSINTPGMTTMRYWALTRTGSKVIVEERVFPPAHIELVD